MTMLTRLYYHHHWANLRLIDTLSELATEALELSTPGGFGTIRETLVHYILNERVFIELLKGGVSAGSAPPAVPPTLAELRTVADSNHERILVFASELDEASRTAGSYRGRDFDFPAFVPLFQAYHHGVEHRTNITVTLSGHGLSVPNLDLWTYSEAGAPT